MQYSLSPSLKEALSIKSQSDTPLSGITAVATPRKASRSLEQGIAAEMAPAKKVSMRSKRPTIQGAAKPQKTASATLNMPS